MSGLILIGIGLTAFLGAFCILIYTRVVTVASQTLNLSEQIGRIEVALHQIVESQQIMMKRVDELASDVLQRDIYQSADDRHHLAILDAKEGLGVSLLVQKHGLSSDEAALIIALHGSTTSYELRPMPERADLAASVDMEN